MTTTDVAGMLRAVLANPADDTARLVLADALEEAGERERAEFIRMQCRVAQLNAEAMDNEDCGQPGCDICDERRALLARSDALRTAHETEWRRAGACAACRGVGAFVTSTRANTLTAPCPHCWSGDVGGLLRTVSAEWNGGGRFGVDVPLRVDFERGFPGRVHCKLEDVCEPSNGLCVVCRGYCPSNQEPFLRDGRWCWTCFGCDGTGQVSGAHRPTLWALAVVRHHPVTSFVVSDRTPQPWNLASGRGERFSWFCESQTTGSPACLPKPVFDAITGELPESEAFGKRFLFAADANDALYTALSRFVRAAGSSPAA